MAQEGWHRHRPQATCRRCDQAREVAKVKRSEAGILRDPITIPPTMKIRDVIALTSQHGVSGFPVTEGKRCGRHPHQPRPAVRGRPRDHTVAAVMTSSREPRHRTPGNDPRRGTGRSSMNRHKPREASCWLTKTTTELRGSSPSRTSRRRSSQFRSRPRTILEAGSASALPSASITDASARRTARGRRCRRRRGRHRARAQRERARALSSTIKTQKHAYRGHRRQRRHRRSAAQRPG